MLTGSELKLSEVFGEAEHFHSDSHANELLVLGDGLKIEPSFLLACVFKFSRNGTNEFKFYVTFGRR